MIRLVYERWVGEFVKPNHVVVEPLLVRMLSRDLVLELFIVDHSPLFDVGEKHSTWLEPSFQQDVFGRNVEHADLGSHDYKVVFRYVVARGTQSVAIQDGADSQS